ncbi:hypothetical protein BDR22DRAFT_89802 [Usnea florida]
MQSDESRPARASDLFPDTFPIDYISNNPYDRIRISADSCSKHENHLSGRMLGHSAETWT